MVGKKYAHFGGEIYLTVAHHYELCGLTEFTQVLEQYCSILCTTHVLHTLSFYWKVGKTLESFSWSLVTYLQLKIRKYISKGVIIKSLLPSISCTNITFCYLFLYPLQSNQKLNARLQRSQCLCRIQNQVCNCCYSFLYDICTVLTFQSVLYQYKDFLLG